MWTLIFIAAYLVAGNLLHRIIFPEKKPAVSKCFKPGQELYSKTEGFRQTVVKQENGYVHCTLQIAPFAAGPPVHIHTGFDEIFQIENGELTVWVNGEIKKLQPGETLRIPKGTPHKPYNETADTIRIKGAIAFPEKFAFCLVQVYAVMDSQPGFERSSKAILQMPLFQANGFDSYLADGPPVFLQKTMGFVIAPLARLLGYRSYYRKYDPLLIKK
ncbi:cupin domain-containing protein [Chitinophaga sp. GCM10012297]|uniref:Cupin domain-containing protein n=2 Tax=Chitinophagaceae TaxID=563835 RepID=A0ABS3YLT1_9BACT|nr:cupin domain-containing protein [Chitinophaga chungangae]